MLHCIFEGIHTQLKNWKALIQVNNNKALPHMIVDYRIVASIINCFYSRLANDDEDDLYVARKMKELLNTQNKLQKLIQQKNLIRMTKFTELEASQDIGFPRLTERDIEMKITFGDYQIDQARGYIREHFDQNGDVKRSMAKEESLTPICVVCCRFHSRHRSQTIYKVFVQLDFSQQGYKSISGWFCDCKAGARTFGCYHTLQQLSSTSASTSSAQCQNILS